MRSPWAVRGLLLGFRLLAFLCLDFHNQGDDSHDDADDADREVDEVEIFFSKRDEPVHFLRAKR